VCVCVCVSGIIITDKICNYLFDRILIIQLGVGGEGEMLRSLLYSILLTAVDYCWHPI